MLGCQEMRAHWVMCVSRRMRRVDIDVSYIYSDEG